MNDKQKGVNGLIVGTYAAGILKKTDPGEKFREELKRAETPKESQTSYESPIQKAIEETNYLELKAISIENALRAVETTLMLLQLVFAGALFFLLFWIGDEYVQPVLSELVEPKTNIAATFIYLVSAGILCLMLMKGSLRGYIENAGRNVEIHVNLDDRKVEV